MRLPRTARLVAPVLLLLAAAWPLAASAHAFPTHSEPPVGATVCKAPAKVVVRFDSLLEPAFSSLKVFSADGRRVDRGPAGTDAERNRLTVKMPALKAGTYHVEWVAVARDGHRTEGDYDFTIAPSC